MLTQPSDEIRALNSLRGMHGAVLLQDAVMSYSSFPYARWLSPNKLHEYKQFYLQFFAYIFLAYSYYGFSQPYVCSSGTPRISLYSEPKGAFKNIGTKSSLEDAVYLFMEAITCTCLKKKKGVGVGGAFSLLYICVYFIENLANTLISLSFYSESVNPKLEVLCFRGKK